MSLASRERMDTASVETTPRTHAAARAARTRSGATKRTASKARPRAPRATAHNVSAAGGEQSLPPINVELLEDLRDMATRKARAIVRDKPVAALGGAFAVGFLMGGGWKTRIGRLILFAANRYIVFQTAKRTLGV